MDPTWWEHDLGVDVPHTKAGKAKRLCWKTALPSGGGLGWWTMEDRQDAYTIAWQSGDNLNRPLAKEETRICDEMS
jgi:hypothetical protein